MTIKPNSLQEYAGAPHNKATLALVFTDIVNSTAIGTHLGDDEWLAILIEHFNQARKLIELNHGYLIKIIGDACMVAFRTTVDAFNFAVGLFIKTGHPFISIRAGLHFGRVLIVEDDIYGSMVNLTARIQHTIPTFGIAISDPATHDIKSVLGRNVAEFIFTDQMHDLKGFGMQRVWRVMTRDMRNAERERRLARREAGLLQTPAT